jgi:hypothetical protein
MGNRNVIGGQRYVRIWLGNFGVVPSFDPAQIYAGEQSAAHERRLVFDPTNLTDGIELSADPLPLARSAAYSISYDYRSKGT